MSRIFRILWCLSALVLNVPAIAQQSTTDNFSITTTYDREVLVLPSHETSTQMQLELGSINGRSFETNLQRVHIVVFDGKTFRASTPLAGPSSRIVFDPSRRTFVQLLPSIRVELEDDIHLDSIARAVGAEKMTFFETLGFAIIDLPETLHPTEAIARLAAHPEQPKATIRLRGPGIEWR